MPNSRQIADRLQFPEVFEGSLAEDYDGIGQFVTVGMNRSSTSSALRVKVTAGDIGLGRPFPSGTGVLIHAERGQLRILSLGGGGGAAQVYHPETQYDAREPQELVLTGIDGFPLVGTPERVINGFNIYALGIFDGQVGQPTILAGGLRYPLINTLRQLRGLRPIKLVETKLIAPRSFR